jgi:POT family proton-dependent oligopeptide transporter
LSGPLQNYIQNAPHDELRPGGLGLGQANATRINLCFMLWSYLTPVIGAIVADQHLGRLRTIMGASGFYTAGLVVLVVTSLPPARESGMAVLGLLLAMLLLGTGSGGIKPNVSALIAEQYTEPERKIRTLKTGEQVVLDRDMTVQRY